MIRTIEQKTLERARDLAGGVSFLARRFGLGADELDAMITGAAPIPYWVLLRAVQFANEVESEGRRPPGFPSNWRDESGGDGS